MQLTLMRRAETSPAESSDSVRLSPLGEQQVETAISDLRAGGAEAVATSRMPRALVTADRVAHELDVPLLPQAGLEERSFGEWDSWDWPHIAARLGPLSIEERYSFVPPGGESWQQMNQRLSAAVERISALPFNNVIVVTHWGPIRALIPLLTGEPKETTLDLAVANGERVTITSQ